MTNQPQQPEPRGQVAYESFNQSMQRKGALSWDELTIDEKMAWEIAALDAIVYDAKLANEKKS